PGRVICRWTMRGLWRYFRARYVFYTHGIFGYARPPASKTVVNLWHGMPIKRIGLDDARAPMQATFTVATSPLFQKIICKAWGLPVDRVPITGLPRNDRLIRAAAYTRVVQPTSSKLILWMPTYRRSVIGDQRAEGSAGRESPGGLRGFDPAAFDTFLDEINAV